MMLTRITSTNITSPPTLVTPRNPSTPVSSVIIQNVILQKTLEKIDNSIYILGGEAEQDIDLIIKEYTKM